MADGEQQISPLTTAPMWPIKDKTSEDDEDGAHRGQWGGFCPWNIKTVWFKASVEADNARRKQYGRYKQTARTARTAAFDIRCLLPPVGELGGAICGFSSVIVWLAMRLGGSKSFMWLSVVSFCLAEKIYVDLLCGVFLSHSLPLSLALPVSLSLALPVSLSLALPVSLSLSLGLCVYTCVRKRERKKEEKWMLWKWRRYDYTTYVLDVDNIMYMLNVDYIMCCMYWM